jgi:hypothetical protein
MRASQGGIVDEAPTRTAVEGKGGAGRYPDAHGGSERWYAEASGARRREHIYEHVLITSLINEHGGRW